MGGNAQGPSQNTNQQQSQSSQTAPWAPAQPLLQDILNQLSGQNTGVTTDQSNAINNVTSAANTIPNFGPTAAGGVNALFGSSTAPQQGLLNSAFGNYLSGSTPLQGFYGDIFTGGANNPFNQAQSTLGGMLDPNYTNPFTNPALKGALDTMSGDITNNINNTFAAAGRSGSPGNTQALARGLAQGQSGMLANEFNQLSQNQLGASSALNNIIGTRMGAAGAQGGLLGNLFGAGNTTAMGTANLGQLPLSNILSGITAAGQIPGLTMAPATTQLGAANTAYGLPYSNIAGLLGLTSPIAGLGTQSSGQGTGTGMGTTSTPWGPAVAGGIIGGLGALGQFGQGVPGLKSLFS